MTILYEKIVRRYKPVMTDDWSIQDGLDAAEKVLAERIAK